MNKLYLVINGWHQKELIQIDMKVSHSPFVHDLDIFNLLVHKVATEEKYEFGIE